MLKLKIYLTILRVTEWIHAWVAKRVKTDQVVKFRDTTVQNALKPCAGKIDECGVLSYGPEALREARLTTQKFQTEKRDQSAGNLERRTAKEQAESLLLGKN